MKSWRRQVKQTYVYDEHLCLEKKNNEGSGLW